MFARSGRLPQLTQMTGTPAVRSAGNTRPQRTDRGAVGAVIAADMVNPATFGAEIVLHVDHEDRGAMEVDHDRLRFRRQIQPARRRRGSGHIDGVRRREPVCLRADAQRPEMVLL